MAQSPKKYAVVGGGFAGLSAAYELLRNDKTCIVTLFERDPAHVGGNIYTRVKGDVSPIDFGVIEIFIYYKSVNAIIHELYGPRALEGQRPIRSTDHAFSSDSETVPIDREADSVRRVQLLGHVLRSWRFYHLSHANHEVENDLDMDTLYAEYMYSSESRQKHGRAYIAGYTYGPLNEWFLGIAGGVRYRQGEPATLFNCNVQDIVSKMLRVMSGASPTAIDKAEEHVANAQQTLNARGRFVVKLGHALTSVGTRTITTKHLGDTPQEHTEFDNVILAMPCTPLVTEALAAVSGRALAPIKYTQTWALLIKFDQELPTSHFAVMVDTALFDDTDSMAIISFAATAMCTTVPGTVVMYVRVNPDVKSSVTEQIVRQFVTANYQRIHALKNMKTLNIIEVHPFPHTMPYGIAQAAHINAVKAVTRDSFVHFAGQWCGFPSLEIACYSGRRAATMINGDLEKFDAYYRHVDRFYVLKKISAPVLAAIFFLIILIMLPITAARAIRS